MTFANDAALNAIADAAAFDEWRFHFHDPQGDYKAFVDAGPYAISMTGAGVAGPDPALHPATPGRNYANAWTAVTLSQACGWESVRNSTTGAFLSWRRPRGPLGPGTFTDLFAFNGRPA